METGNKFRYKKNQISKNHAELNKVNFHPFKNAIIKEQFFQNYCNGVFRSQKVFINFGIKTQLNSLTKSL